MHLAGQASAQEPQTREEADRQRREQQAQQVSPYKPNGLERALDFAEDKAIFLLDREGIHPKLGSLTTGSGFAYGLGFRDRDLFSNSGQMEVWVAGSRIGSLCLRSKAWIIFSVRLKGARIYLEIRPLEITTSTRSTSSIHLKESTTPGNNS